MLSDILLPYQKELVKHPPNKKIIVRKSRRTGYTWAQSLRMIFDCFDNQPWNIISYRLESSKLVIEDCIFWVNKLVDLGLTKLNDWELLKESVTYKPNRCIVRALPCVASVIRGKKGNVFIDEAAHIPQLKEILDAVRPLSIWGYGITLISSPFLPGLFEELSRDPSWEVHSLDIYQAANQGLYVKICEEQGKNEPTQEETDLWVKGLLLEAGKSASHEYLCSTIQDSKGDWVSESTEIIDLPVIFPASDLANRNLICQESHVIGVDVGVAENPTFITCLGKNGLLRLIELRNRTIPQLNRFISSLINQSTRKVAIDTNGIGRGLADLLAEKHISIIQYSPNTSQWFSSECVSFLSGVWSGDNQISSDPLVMADLASVEMADGKIRLKERTIEGQKRHCDSIPSMVLAYQNKSLINGSMYL